MLNMIKHSAMAALAALTWATLPAYAQPQAKTQSGTVAGRFTVEHPTLENLGFEWAITGDTNRNASVSVEFRRAGETVWRKALPGDRAGREKSQSCKA